MEENGHHLKKDFRQTKGEFDSAVKNRDIQKSEKIANIECKVKRTISLQELAMILDELSQFYQWGIIT